jgi:hypothetical protein
MLIRAGVILKHQSTKESAIIDNTNASHQFTEVEMLNRKEIQDIEEQMKSPFLQNPQVCTIINITQTIFVVDYYFLFLFIILKDLDQKSNRSQYLYTVIPNDLHAFLNR